MIMCSSLCGALKTNSLVHSPSVMISPDHPELSLTPGVLRNNQDEVTIPSSSSKAWRNLKISTSHLAFFRSLQVFFLPTLIRSVGKLCNNKIKKTDLFLSPHYCLTPQNQFLGSPLNLKNKPRAQNLNIA